MYYNIIIDNSIEKSLDLLSSIEC